MAAQQAERLCKEFDRVVVASGAQPGSVVEVLREIESPAARSRVAVIEENDFVQRFRMAANLAGTEFVAMLPEDDVPMPPTIRALSEYMTGRDECAIGSGKWISGIGSGGKKSVVPGGSLVSCPALGVTSQMPDLLQWRFLPELYWGVYRTSLVNDIFERSMAARSAFVRALPGMTRISSWRVFELTVILATQARYSTVHVEAPLLIKDDKRTMASRLDRWSGFLELESLLASGQAADAVSAWRETLLDPGPGAASVLDECQADWAEAALVTWSRDARGRPRLRARGASAIRKAARKVELILAAVR